MSKKILIVYEKMGMGHFRMAGILEDILKGEDVEIIKLAGSEMIGDTSINSVVKCWNYCIKKNWIKTVDLLLNFILRIFILPFIEVSSTAPYHAKLEEIKPDIIICTADGFNKAIGSYAKEKGIPFYVFITEVSIFIDLVNPYATHICYFNETGEAIRNYDFSQTYYSYKLNSSSTLLEKIEYILGYYKDFVLQGYKNSIYRNPDRSLEQRNEANFRVVGPLAEKKHFTQKEINAAKDKFGINNGKDTVIIASGSIGGEFLTEMVETMCKDYSKPLNVMIVCGRDEDSYIKLSALKDRNINANINLMPFRYIENFDELLSAADCLIGRPSAGIFIESIVNRTPEITFRKVTSNDRGTLTMIEKYNIGKVVEDKNEVISALDHILSNKNTYQNNIEQLLNMYCRSYEDKKELLRDIILSGSDCSYEVDESLDAEMGFNAPLSH